MAENLQRLESNDSQVYEEARQQIHTQFNKVKESWLLNGLYDYYLQTNSFRAMEILINIREPHHTFLFDKLSDSIRSSKIDNKVKALTLFGHVVRKQPTWLYKISQHSIFKELLKMLMAESEVLPLLSGLLVLVVLLPNIPTLMNFYLQDVFEIFSRLAAWNCSSPSRLVEEQLVHMQIGLYALFQRLYGMFPCNFLSYLRLCYKQKDKGSIFLHTIRPMVQTVILNPMLVTATRDSETSAERWKKMSALEVVMECEKYSLDLRDHFSHDICLPCSSRSRSGTLTSASSETSYSFLRNIPPPVTPSQILREDFFSPANVIIENQTPPIAEMIATPRTGIPLIQGHNLMSSILQSQEGTSPPEAAIEATPETTPIKDARAAKHQSTTVARALNSFVGRNRTVGSASTTPTHSQPSSPMRRDISSFGFPSVDHRHASAFGMPKQSGNQRLKKLILDRTHLNEVPSEIVVQQILPPTSPLRIIPHSGDNSVPSSPLPIISQHQQVRIESPITQEDEEVNAIVRRGELSSRTTSLRRCDSVLYDNEGGGRDDLNDEFESGSPCAAGGIHMPNAKQISEFHKSIKRLRYHSQCAPDNEQTDQPTESSSDYLLSPASSIVRRANSCPEMKKSVTTNKDNISKTLEENEEESVNDNNQNLPSGVDCSHKHSPITTTVETQTDIFWPMPYEHLFLSIFPSMESTDVKTMPSPSPAFNSQDKIPATPYDILDRYIEVSANSNDSDSVKALKDQIKLLHQQILFERDRRESHAVRNRTLFTDSTKNRVLEDHNSALSEQIQLQERAIDLLENQLNHNQRDQYQRELVALETGKYWENKHDLLKNEVRQCMEKIEDYQNMLDLEKKKVIELDLKWQDAEGKVSGLQTEIDISNQKGAIGDQARTEVNNLNREILIAYELIEKYRERLRDPEELRAADVEIENLTAAYSQELGVLHQQLQTKSVQLETARYKISELDCLVLHKEELKQKAKNHTIEVIEDYNERLQTVEDKYVDQLAVSTTLSKQVWNLIQEIEMITGKPYFPTDDEVNNLAGHMSTALAQFSTQEGALPNPPNGEFKSLKEMLDESERKNNYSE